MGRFIMKHVDNRKPQIKKLSVVKGNKVADTETKSDGNDKKKSDEVMTTNEKIAMAQSVLSDTLNTKRIKKDKGLIERTESSKTILTEDNKELLKD